MGSRPQPSQIWASLLDPSELLFVATTSAPSWLSTALQSPFPRQGCLPKGNIKAFTEILGIYLSSTSCAKGIIEFGAYLSTEMSLILPPRGRMRIISRCFRCFFPEFCVRVWGAYFMLPAPDGDRRGCGVSPSFSSGAAQTRPPGLSSPAMLCAPLLRLGLRHLPCVLSLDCPGPTPSTTCGRHPASPAPPIHATPPRAPAVKQAHPGTARPQDWPPPPLGTPSLVSGLPHPVTLNLACNFRWPFLLCSIILVWGDAATLGRSQYRCLFWSIPLLSSGCH